MTEKTRPRPSWTTVAAAVIIALVGVLVAWTNGRDERSHASVGDLVDAADTLTGTRSSFVLLPTGRLDIRATGSLDDVDRDADVRRKQAPEDGSYIGLQVVARATTGTNAIIDPNSYQAFYNEPISLTLVADGRRYPVGSGGDSTSPPFPLSSYLAVAGTPSRLSFEVSYRGKTQQVDLRTGTHRPGVFADLYRNRARTASCSGPTWTAGATPIGTAASCSVEGLLRTPYYPRLGWAPSGRAWLVTRVGTTGADGFTYRGSSGAAVTYERARSMVLNYRLDGAKAANVTGILGSPGVDITNTVVFSVPTDRTTSPRTLVVSAGQQARLREDNPRSASLPSERYLRLVTGTWTVRL